MGSVVGSVTGENPTVVGTLTVTGPVQATRYVATSAGAVTSGSESFEVLGRGGVYSSGAAVVDLAGAGVQSCQFAGGLVSPNGQVYAGTLTTTGALRTAPTALQTITAVGDTITFTGTGKRLASDGNRTLTSTPPIALGVAGDWIVLTYEGANTLTISDVATCNLGAATRALSAGDMLGLKMNAAATAWEEMFFANN